MAQVETQASVIHHRHGIGGEASKDQNARKQTSAARTFVAHMDSRNTLDMSLSQMLLHVVDHNLDAKLGASGWWC
ncbi:hypothetical protein I3842_03G204700 [Carya illinoinensis]|uniref:Uncharacterized protein n=1 Tax=Carya illinoinensis TaxID=32201 RepID=A0A922FIG7_CARIL|nr:hypothetical protein I3842_03G204700 [Carya illinoinensis]